jgi:gas vesicle protein
MRKNSKGKLSATKKLIIGSGIAAGAGYLAGILTAPKSGKETRGDIKDAAEKGRRDAEKELKKLLTELGDLVDEAKKKGAVAGKKGKEEMKIALEKAQDTKEKVREVLSAFHEGDAEDDDLRRAVKNANTSIQSLKKYLKK